MYSWKYSNLKGLVLIIEVVFVQTKNSGSGSEPKTGCVCFIASALSMLMFTWKCVNLELLVLKMALSLVRLDEQMPGP